MFPRWLLGLASRGQGYLLGAMSRFLRVLVTVLAAFALAACDDVDVNVGDDDPDPAPTRSPVDRAFEELDECTESSAPEGAPVGVTMMDNFFEPPCIAISSTQQITFANSGTQLHNFSVADGDIDVDVEPGEEATTDETGTDLAAGTYRFVCKYHQEQGMIGTLVIE